MQRAHDLGRTPSLVDAEIADNVRCLEATIGTGEGRIARNAPDDVAVRTGSRSICVMRRISAASVADKPLPNCAV